MGWLSNILKDPSCEYADERFRHRADTVENHPSSSWVGSHIVCVVVEEFLRKMIIDDEKLQSSPGIHGALRSLASCIRLV